MELQLPIGPKVVPFCGFIFRIEEGNPNKELLWGLWVVLGFRIMLRRALRLHQSFQPLNKPFRNS